MWNTIPQTVNFRNLFFLLLILICVLIFKFSWTSGTWFNKFIFSDLQNDTLSVNFTPCSGELHRMVIGHWSYRRYNESELEEVEKNIRRQRDFYSIPSGLQRNDGKCGNLNYEGLEWFRAVCNHKGDTPCCFNNTCVHRTLLECQCTDCYDFRSQMHAELADWIPSDPTCKILEFNTKEEVCDVLQNATVYFVGESYLRQIYVSLLSVFEKNDSANIFEANTPPDMRQKCNKRYRYIAECRFAINHNLIECDNSTEFRCIEIYETKNVGTFIQAFKELSGKNNSWFIFGLGHADHFNAMFVLQKLIEPVLAEAAKSEWPKIIWHEPHAVGHLKTPKYPGQLNPSRLKFSVEVEEFLTNHSIPFVNFFNMTKPVVSYDGSHYGKGVNDLKLQILLNYIKEQRTRLNV